MYDSCFDGRFGDKRLERTPHERENYDLVEFSYGITSQLHSLDVLVNLLKYNLRKDGEAWLVSEKLSVTLSGKIKRACASKPAEWVSTDWKKIAGKKSETIVQEMLHYK
jgi:hypothetical protein